MAKILKGIDVVNAMTTRLGAQVRVLQGSGVTPKLSILRVGDKPDQISYEKAAVKRCEGIGVTAESIILPQETTQEDVITKIETLNNDKDVHGILILRPLPEHINDNEVRAALCPDKDIDGITDASLANVFTGTGTGFTPCTAKACIEILKHYKIDCTGKRAVVIGRSLVVGKPVAMMLLSENATVTVCHTKTTDMRILTKLAHIVISAAGQAESLTAEFFSPGQVVIDVGTNWIEKEQRLCGDVKFDEVEKIVGAITPVPGGVGTVTTAVLISNVVAAARRSAGL